LNNPDLKAALKIPIENGLPCLIESIENEVDPMLDPVLEKQYTVKGRRKILQLSDAECDVDPKFTLYMTSRLANPHFSPELAAKATIIDFTVTQNGLE
jgi:dynein heavy chain